jgi:polyketide biosynthesis enoyl-CoA hydratase PksI
VNNSVVNLLTIFPGIAQLTMVDRAHKNAFSSDLVTELLEAFATIERDESLRVLILTGYSNYFACGGTKAGLLDLHQGRGSFADSTFYSLSLTCPIPVIAAMQGHGIGGGFVFGLFADFVVLSRESVYTANFMRYGFTPGMGATYIVPKKLGVGLGTEMLIGARSYRGSELEKRGIAFPVLPRSDVLVFAKKLARDIAEKPRQSLVLLKDHLVADMRVELPDFIAKEVQMHVATFRQAEVGERIATCFGK